MMDQEPTLSWHGPIWHSGVDLGLFGLSEPSLDLPGLPKAINLLELDAKSDDLASLATEVPCVVLLDQTHFNGPNGAAHAEFITRLLKRVKPEVPVIVFVEPGRRYPPHLRPTAILEASAPPDVIFSTICFLQRALIRAEEARIRRRIFGRVSGYGVASRLSGGSGVLVIGVSGRFLQVQNANAANVQVVGAFNQAIGQDYLEQRAFDAVVIDEPFAEALESLHRIRRDARFSALPVMVVAEGAEDSAVFYRAGATDVLTLPLAGETLSQRLAVAVRLGKRRRLADRVLAETHHFVIRQIREGGLKRDLFDRYLEMSASALASRGLTPYQLRMNAENLGETVVSLQLAPNLYETVLSIADATSREEDLICLVEGLGPVAVLKSRPGLERLQKRISAILGHTQI